MANRQRQTARRRQSQAQRSRLPFLLVIGGVLVLAAAAFFALRGKTTPFTPQVTGGPSLRADKEVVDLGDERLGNTAAVSFQLQNVGDQPLQFTEVPYIEVKEGC